jgi:hypothetical protein
MQILWLVTFRRRMNRYPAISRTALVAFRRAFRVGSMAIRMEAAVYEPSFRRVNPVSGAGEPQKGKAG